MEHANLDLVRRVYGAFMTGDRETLIKAFEPNVQWHISGYDANAGDLDGIEAVLAHLWEGEPIDDYHLDIVDMLVSDERVAVVARTSGRLGDRAIANDYVQVIRIVDGMVNEVWNYTWDQRALAEAMPVPA